MTSTSAEVPDSSPPPERPSVPMIIVGSNQLPQRIARWFLMLIVALGICDSVYTPDLPKAQLIAKYGAAPSRFLKLPSGARVHYRDQGNMHGPALVLLHGSNSSLHTWEPWVARLRDTFRLITFDLPGHGLTGPVPSEDYSPDSMVAFVDQVRRALGLSHFFLGGNSMGGHVSWRYTIAHPDAVSALVLVDAAGLNHLLPANEQPTLPIGFKIARTPGLNLLMQVITPRSVVEKTTRAVFVDQSKVTPQMIHRYYDLLLYPGNRRATQLRAAAKVNLATVDHLSEIRVPTLVLSGASDTLVPLAAARMLHERIHGSELIVYPNVGHVPMEEVPDRSAADVRAFLAHVANPAR